MRPLVTLGAVASIGLLCLAIVAGGRYLSDGTPSITVEQIDPEMLDLPEPEVEMPADDVGAGILVQPEEAEPSSETTAGYQRVEPRKPLSEIGQARPPKPKAPTDFDGATLYRPVTNAAGTFEAMGYAVTVAGIETVEPGEVCDFKGQAWPCGVRARAAFRAFLRGRAVTCAVPPDVASGAITAECRIGRQNVGEWLVENGWARAAPGSFYAELTEKAAARAKGIFGPPPSSADLAPLSGLSGTGPSEEPVAIPLAPAQ